MRLADALIPRLLRAVARVSLLDPLSLSLSATLLLLFIFFAF